MPTQRFLLTLQQPKEAFCVIFIRKNKALTSTTTINQFVNFGASSFRAKETKLTNNTFCVSSKYIKARTTS